MDAPPPRRPGIKLNIPNGNVPGNYSSNQAGESSGEWDVRPIPPPLLPGRRPPGPSLGPLVGGSSSTPTYSNSNSNSNIMATPPPRRPMIPINSQAQSQSTNGGTTTPKLSLVTRPPGSGSSSGTSTPRLNVGSGTLGQGPPQLNLSIGGGRPAPPKPRAPILSLNIPLPGSNSNSQQGRNATAGPPGLTKRETDSSQPSPAYDELGGMRTAMAYNGGLRTPTKEYDPTGGQTTIGRGGGRYGGGDDEEDDPYGRESYENQRTIKGMTEDLRNALSQMRVTPSATPSGSVRGSWDGSAAGHPGFGGDELGSGAVTGDEEAGLGRTISRTSTSSGGHVGMSVGSGPGSVSGEKKTRQGGAEQDLDPKNYEGLMRLGEGAGGAVEKVRDRKTGKILAMKVITTSPNPAIHKQLLRELQFLNECQSPYVVEHYGSFLTNSDTCIGILMEFCEAGSLDTLVRKIARRGGRTSEKVLGKIAEAVLGGLDYLHERKIIHRDIKPSNILVTRGGQVKLCDFGVSGELVDSFAGTFTGTSFYMAPERIQGLSYSIKSDIWSLGLTLHEVAHNRFPFPPEGEPPLGGPIELLNFIVAQPVPRLIDSPEQRIVWTSGAQDFLAKCLIRSANERPYPRDLLKHPWIRESAKRNVNLAKWVAAIHGWE